MLHGTTGEVLYWEYDNRQNGCGYVNMLPGEGEMSREEVEELAYQRYEQIITGYGNVPEETYTDLALAPADNWWLVPKGKETMPVWRVLIQTPVEKTPGLHYALYVSAEDAAILREKLVQPEENGRITVLMEYTNEEYFASWGQP